MASSWLGPTVSSWARARCSRLLTATVVVPMASATSAAFHCRTSRSSSTARCRGDRCCSAAMNASRTDSREPTITDGSVGSLLARPAAAPATAPRHALRVRRSGSELGAPSPVGSGRRWRPSSAVRQVLVAMRCSQVRTDDLPSKPVVGLPGAQVGLLHQILGVVQGAGHAVAVRQQFAAVPLCVGEKGVRIFIETPCEHAHGTELTQGHRQRVATLLRWPKPRPHARSGPSTASAASASSTTPGPRKSTGVPPKVW